jgi:pyrimidine operon attenuation protein/uracil phosphoribosyltransferase
MKIILNADQIEEAIGDMTARIIADLPSKTGIAVIGLRSRGVIIAQRIADSIAQKTKNDVPHGSLDITLYRDDINDPHGDGQPTVRSTEIPFDIRDMVIILVDDVLYTGRSIRAAMDALIDLGRPRAIRLAVLVDRGGRELPIQPDYCGRKVDVSSENSVHVSLKESDEKEQVVVE